MAASAPAARNERRESVFIAFFQEGRAVGNDDPHSRCDRKRKKMRRAAITRRRRASEMVSGEEFGSDSSFMWERRVGPVS